MREVRRIKENNKEKGKESVNKEVSEGNISHRYRTLLLARTVAMSARGLNVLKLKEELRRPGEPRVS